MKKFLITLLILALILSGTNLTAVHADELTPASDDSVLNQNIVFSQDDNPITGSSKINVNKVIKAGLCQVLVGKFPYLFLLSLFFIFLYHKQAQVVC